MANSVDPDQSQNAPSLSWVHIVCPDMYVQKIRITTDILQILKRKALFLSLGRFIVSHI